MTTKQVNDRFNAAPDEVIKAIKVLREKKGREDETLQLIDNALNAAHDYVFNLIGEKFLVYQHEVMEEQVKDEKEKDNKRIELGIRHMMEEASNALEYAENNNLSRWFSRAYRMLGRASDYQGGYNEAIEYYQKAIDLVSEDPEYKDGYPRQFEYFGFMAYSLIQAGRIEEGVNLARKTYKEYDDSNDGKALFKKDYTTWAIWKSGIAERTVRALLDKNSKILSDDEMRNWLLDAQNKLIPPKGVKVWADFQLRKDEFKNILKILH